MFRAVVKFLLIFIVFVSFTFIGRADFGSDIDKDGISDDDEINVYCTDPNNKDTDGDGYSDWEELNNGYSPLNKEPVKLENCDYDNDGLSDRMELNFGTNIKNEDTDGDGYLDGEEIKHGYSPRDRQKILLDKRIEINTGEQKLYYYLDGVRIGSFLISSGVDYMPTPKGHYEINNKHPKAWSSYGLWMPYWMAFSGSKYGLHQLPIWPNGAVEGEEHLGKKASHGCVRMGEKDSKFLYEWAEIGTPIFIY